MRFSNVEIACLCINVILIGKGIYDIFRDEDEQETKKSFDDILENNSDTQENYSYTQSRQTSDTQENYSYTQSRQTSDTQENYSYTQSRQTSDTQENTSDTQGNLSDTQENYSYTQSKQSSNDVTPKKTYILADSVYDTIVEDKVNKQVIFKDKKFLRSLIYCTKVVKFMDRELLEMFTVPKENPRELIKLSDEFVEKLFEQNICFSVEYISSDISVLEAVIDTEISYLNEVFSHLENETPLSPSVGDPKLISLSNMNLKYLLKEYISEAFPKDVQEDMFEKRFRYESIDYAFDTFDVYYYEAISFWIRYQLN
ncbi:hypothetical protein P3W45_000569 [Vairimorpha bombi]|jgi:hypothetical protein